MCIRTFITLSTLNFLLSSRATQSTVVARFTKIWGYFRSTFLVKFVFVPDFVVLFASFWSLSYSFTSVDVFFGALGLLVRSVFTFFIELRHRLLNRVLEKCV